jgi:hypothetical protein
MSLQLPCNYTTTSHRRKAAAYTLQSDFFQLHSYYRSTYPDISSLATTKGPFYRVHLTRLDLPTNGMVEYTLAGTCDARQYKNSNGYFNFFKIRLGFLSNPLLTLTNPLFLYRSWLVLTVASFNVYLLHPKSYFSLCDQ